MTYPKTFRHDVTSGYIFIRNAVATESIYPYSWWITQEPAYTYPVGATYVQYYEDGTAGQSYYSNGTSQFPLPVDPWTTGDGYIAKQAVYDAAYAAVTPDTLEEAQDLKYSELKSEYNTAIYSGVTYDNGSGNDDYDSGYQSFTRLCNDMSLFDATGSVPVGYYVVDTLLVHKTFDLAHLKGLVQAMQTLRYNNNLVYDTHYENIAALTTISGVMAYDVTTGWV